MLKTIETVLCYLPFINCYLLIVLVRNSNYLTKQTKLKAK